jgi:hypothetical protein
MAEIWEDHRTAFFAHERWDGHAIVSINDHSVWKPWPDLKGADWAVFYDGDYRDALAPDDPPILRPREECSDLPPRPLQVEWDE